jgi:hypothetical protein
VTPVPLDLPLRPPEAAELANLVFSQAERKPLTDELRARIASRAAAIRFASLRPYPGSLERDPVHHSSYYMAVDGQGGEPLLLHMASAAAPTTAIFPKPLLIGRMRRANGPEMVLNAIPFGPADHEAIARFASQLNEAFLPRAQRSRPALVAAPVPAAFEGFRAVWKSSHKNLAAVAMAAGQTDPAAFYHAAIWSAIRTGWREGYTAGIGIAIGNSHLEADRETIGRAAPLTRFAIDVSRMVGRQPAGMPLPSLDIGVDWQLTRDEISAMAAKYGEALKAAERAHELIRQARTAQKISRPFDFELSLEHAADLTSAKELVFCLAWLKARGHAAQLAAPRVDATSDLAALAAAARFSQCTLSLDVRAGDLSSIGRATAGRVNYQLEPDKASNADYVAQAAAALLG